MGVTIKPNGKYLARVRVGGGERLSKVFDTRKEAENWVAACKHDANIMTVDKWFRYWIDNLMGDVRVNTRLSYISRYETWIGPRIGKMEVGDVKPYNLSEIMNAIRDAGLKSSTANSVKIVLRGMFTYAFENGLTEQNPVTKSVKTTCDKSKKETRFLTRHEQKIFLEEAKKHRYYDQFAFVLQTGIRYGELTGLRWEDIDLDHRIMKIRRSAFYVNDTGEFTVGEPKSRNGYRDIFLTDEALEILSRQDKSAEFIFSFEGRPVKRTRYNSMLKFICGKINIEPFSIHKLRHTFATRCIESGMKPKTLQRILGHSDITVTLNYYVHITDNEMAMEMTRFSEFAV